MQSGLLSGAYLSNASCEGWGTHFTLEAVALTWAHIGLFGPHAGDMDGVD